MIFRINWIQRISYLYIVQIWNTILNIKHVNIAWNTLPYSQVFRQGWWTPLQDVSYLNLSCQATFISKIFTCEQRADFQFINKMVQEKREIFCKSALKSLSNNYQSTSKEQPQGTDYGPLSRRNDWFFPELWNVPAEPRTSFYIW